ncbi:MAG: purine nucleoside phosphorylase YfiH [Enterobacteriaceae bacterium]
MTLSAQLAPIIPQWPAPTNVFACSTTRQGGVSLPPYDSLNLGAHVDDNPDAVAANRQRLLQWARITQPVRWLEQVHGTEVINLDQTPFTQRQGDAAYSEQPGRVCAVMTADCLPVLFCSANGDEVAAAHAGWRGLCAGVLENTLSCFRTARKHILVWLGPSIGPNHFEVGREVREQFVCQHREAAQAFIVSDAENGKYQANLYLLARQRLAAAGVEQIYGGDHCTFSEQNYFFSYRRARITGRMVTLIGLREK